MRQAVKLFRERGSAEDWSSHLGVVAQTMVAAPIPPPLPGPRDPELYLGFFSCASDFSLDFSAGIRDKARAWGWLIDQARTVVSDPEWRHRGGS